MRRRWFDDHVRTLVPDGRSWRVAHRQRIALVRNRAIATCFALLVFGGVMLAFPLWLFGVIPG